jgi:hypothetical protein
MSWDKIGDQISGTFDGIHQFYVPGYGYRDEGHMRVRRCDVCANELTIAFTLPTDLRDKLSTIKRGTPVTITYTGRRGPAKMFDVAVQA